jgi:hypothetical protein
MQPAKWHIDCFAHSQRTSNRVSSMERMRRQDIVYTVEPDSRAANHWYIKLDGAVRATYPTRAQAIVDARQLAAFENELRGRNATVRVFDEQQHVVENLVSEASRPYARVSGRRSTAPPGAPASMR